MGIGSNFITRTGDTFIPSWMYKTSAKKSFIDQADDVFKKDRSGTFQKEFLSWRRTLVYAALVLIVIHLGVTGTYLGLSIAQDSTSLSANLYVNTPGYDPSTFSFTSNLMLLTSTPYHLWWLIIGLPCICIIFLFMYIYTGWSAFQSETEETQELLDGCNITSSFFYEILLIGGNQSIWILNATAGSGVIWIVATLSGITDLTMLVALVGINVAFQFTGGLFHEWWNNGMTQAFRFDLSRFHDVWDPTLEQSAVGVENQWQEQGISMQDGKWKDKTTVQLLEEVNNRQSESRIGVNYPKAPGVLVRPTSRQEYAEEHSEESVRWIVLMVGLVLFLVTWGVIFTYFTLAVYNITAALVPWYTWTIVFSMFGLMLVFTAGLIIHYVYVDSEGKTFLRDFEQNAHADSAKLITNSRLAAVKRNGAYELFKLIITHSIVIVMTGLFLVAIYVR